jgi:DNA-binding NarL/FixJ family response regulator
MKVFQFLPIYLSWMHSNLPMTGFSQPAAPSTTAARRLRVVVADDHPVCSQLMPRLLAPIGCDVVAVTEDGETAIQQCEQLRPDILLLDLVLPKLGGIEVLQRIRKQNLPIKVVLFTGSFSTEVLREAMVWGIEGCILKTSTMAEIEQAFQKVRAGQLALSADAAEALRRIVVNQDEAAVLTELETAVLRQTAEGRAVKTMAADLALSESGVYKVLERVKRKLGAQSLQELTLAAVRRRLLVV